MNILLTHQTLQYLSARVHTPDNAFKHLVLIIGNIAHNFNRQIKQAYGPHMEIKVVLQYHTSFCDDCWILLYIILY